MKWEINKKINLKKSYLLDFYSFFFPQMLCRFYIFIVFEQKKKSLFLFDATNQLSSFPCECDLAHTVHKTQSSVHFPSVSIMSMKARSWKW